MIPRRPYLFRAIHQWIVDNEWTPHVVFNARHAGVRMPSGHDEDGRVTLNVSADAVRDFVMDDTAISFSARFGGRTASVLIPFAAMLAIYARENVQGMAFTDDDPDDEPAPATNAQPPGKNKPRLKLVE